MRQPLKIGNNVFKFKKDALAYYKRILNSYNFNESLSDNHINDVIALMQYDYLNYLAEIGEEEYECSEETDDIKDLDDFPQIDDIKIARVQFNTKCFEVFFSDDNSFYISYITMINNKRFTIDELFYIACRNTVYDDLRSVKQNYFDLYSIKGEVKCQESNIKSKWTELVVDHRQPNTFSIIVDRFKEINPIDYDNIEFTQDERNFIIFKDGNLSNLFREYHKKKATLRIVRKELNASRTSLARVKKNSKDLLIE